MITVVLYKQFNKDINSTKQPTQASGAAGQTYQADIYDSCSLLAPVIIIADAGTTLQSDGYNYAWIPTFGGRFYWITDMVWQEGRWFIHLDVDVLATYKTAIGETTQYVLRAASSYDDWIIDDAYVPISGKKQLLSVFNGSWPANNPFASMVSSGIFVVAVAGGTPNFGALRYYAMTIDNLTTLINFLLGSTTYLGDLGDVTQDMARLILNPLQYIQSCYWFPFAFPVLGTSVNSITVGWWDVPVSGAGVALVSMTDGATQHIAYGITNIPRHPQAATIGNYLKKDPFSNYHLWVPPVGYIDIPADLLCDVDFINVAYTVDVISGSSLIDVWAGVLNQQPQKRIHSTQAQLAVEVPLAQITGTGVNMVQGVQQLTSGKILGGIEKLATGALGAWLGSDVSGGGIQGSAGTTSVYRRVPDLVLNYSEMAETAPALLGRPLCQNKRIDTLSGFIMCGHAHVSIYRAVKQELEAIESFMNGGFFYE